MSNILTPESIMQAAKAPETAVEVSVPEWGGTVLVKGFTRAELKGIRKACTTVTESGGQRHEQLDDDRFERDLFMAGLVEPRLTLDHWNELQNRAPGGIETVTKAILRASNLSKEEAAEIRKSVPAEAGDVV